MSDTQYTPPEVWTWDEPKQDHRFASLNRPIAGPTHEKELPRGKHPLQLHSLGSPNGQKVTILLEELLAAGHAGAEYDAWYIDIMAGDQFGSGFVSINPNSKIPAMLDCSGDKPIRIFESCAILLYLAEKFGAFVPTEQAARAECLSWLMWQVGSAPYIGGGFGHFYAYAPEKIEYAINRYAMETKRLFDVMDRRLAESEYIAGDEYTIADIACFCWSQNFVTGNSYDGGPRFLDVPSYKNLARWVHMIKAREPVRRGLIVNREGEGFVLERHSAADIDAVISG